MSASRTERSEEWWTSLALLTLFSGLAVGVCVGTPGQSVWLPECPFHALTGLYCTGCGSTRMLYYLMHGHFFLAARQNVLALLLLPVLIGKLVHTLMQPDRLKMRPKAHPRWGVALFAMVVSFTVLRNLPIRAGCALAPGGVCALREGTPP